MNTRTISRKRSRYLNTAARRRARESNNLMPACQHLPYACEKAVRRCVLIASANASMSAASQTRVVQSAARSYNTDRPDRRADRALKSSQDIIVDGLMINSA